MSLPVYVSDFTHESDIHESGVFYYYYFVLQFYIYLTIGIILFALLNNSIHLLDARTYTFWDNLLLNLFFSALIPCVLSSIISGIIIAKKKITQFNILFAVILAMGIIAATGGALGLFLSGLVPSLLMMHGNNSVYDYDKLLKLQLAENNRKLEMQLEKEQIIKKLHKAEDRSENLIPIELTREEVSDENGFHFY